MEPQDYDCENGCCPKCDCEVCMSVIANPDGLVDIIRYICPDCGYFVDFDDSTIEFVSIIPPYESAGGS